jgi:hypothetical protein
MIRALVITHGNIGAELVRVTGLILGPVEGLAALSNSGKSLARPADGDHRVAGRRCRLGRHRRRHLRR